MCGIAGIIAKNATGAAWMSFIPAATASMHFRGPDSHNFFSDELISLGHCRLSIIDLSAVANQPMFDVSQRYCIIYNGEIFNFLELRNKLSSGGVEFHSQSDTEVLLQLYLLHGPQMLHSLNGFFAFAIYDRKEKTCFIARDRFGVKPLFFYEDENCLLFASEMKALFQFPLVKKINTVALYEFLQLNYIPGPDTIFTTVKKLLPGHFLVYKNAATVNQSYYSIPQTEKETGAESDYGAKQQELFKLLDDAVRLRLISDVPLGAFLSGGVDSSIICGLAAQHTPHLQTFSIGYTDDDFFDETQYAHAVAKHFNTEHTVFSLSRNDLYESLFSAIDYFDEPFGDSSALPVYVLSKLTRKHVKVALSGDGADELFGGYLKHTGEYRARNAGLGELMIAAVNPFLRMFPKSRNSTMGNRLRQIEKFSEGMKLEKSDRYWKWCGIADEEEVQEILEEWNDEKEFLTRKKELTKFIHADGGINDCFLNDVNLVLPYDMLTKVDSMSMANSLEVRTPFLDYRVVEFAFSIPASYKINRHQRKMILHDAFKKFLPAELYHRPKKGFEIPLHSFLTTELKSVIERELLAEDFIRAQNIFNYPAIAKLKQKLFSPNPDDSAARVWGLVIFQNWWKKWMNDPVS